MELVFNRHSSRPNFYAFPNAFELSEIHLFALRNERHKNQSSFRCFASPFIVALSNVVVAFVSTIAATTTDAAVCHFLCLLSNAIVQNNDADK